MSQLAAKLVEMYDNLQYGSIQHQRFYRYSGYCNFGYWYPDTVDGKQAGDNLVDVLLAMAPTGHRAGGGARDRPRVLDVACGEGGTTSRLMTHFDCRDITAINISSKQLKEAEQNAPGCTFRQMSATDLAFPDGYFATVVCVEAAFHFETRARFLREAYRVLEPGGVLVLSDLLTRIRPVDRLLHRLGHDSLIPQENYETDASYRALMRDIGFERVHMVDAMAHTFDPFYKAFVGACARNLLDFSLWPGIALDNIVVPALPIWVAWHKLWLRSYLLVAAQKPL